MPRKETIVEMEKSIDKGKRQIAKWDQKIMAQERLLKADANLAAAYSRKVKWQISCYFALGKNYTSRWVKITQRVG